MVSNPPIDTIHTFTHLFPRALLSKVLTTPKTISPTYTSPPKPSKTGKLTTRSHRTNGPDIHWSISILAGMPFGFGMILITLGFTQYLIDIYTIYTASVLAGSSILRSLFGAAFPLFTTYMYGDLGIHWASSVPAFFDVGLCAFSFVVL